MGWLLDLCPGDYRGYDVLRKHPAVLARFAAHHVDAAIEAARRGLALSRTELRDVVPASAIDAALQAYEREGARLLGVRRGVALVEAALRGERYVARL